MRIAVLLRGICYKENHVSNGTSGIAHHIDFRVSAPSIKQCIIDSLQSKGHDVDVFCVTYNTTPQNVVHDLLTTYQPKKLCLIPWEGSTQRKTFIEGLSMIHSIYEEPYDAVLCLRYDLWIRSNILDWNIDFSKINFLWREMEFLNPSNALGMCDIIHVIPTPYVKVFLDALKEDLYHQSIHYIDVFLQKKMGAENIHVLLSHICNSNTAVMSNPFYHIVRIKS